MDPPLRVIRWAFEEAVEDGVSEGGVADDIVPVFDGELAGQDGSAPCIAIVEDFEQVMAALAGEGSKTPVIEDQEPGLGEPLERASGRNRWRGRA